MCHSLLIAVLFICLPLAARAEFPPPLVDLRVAGDAPRLATWAHAGGKAVIRIESPAPLALLCDFYQVNGATAIPLSRNVALDSLKPGPTLLEIPLPEKSERGKLLLKISSSPDGKPIANLMVSILPKDAWDSLIKQANTGKVSIDPALKDFRAWADSHGISSTAATHDKPAEFHFGKSNGDPNTPGIARCIIFERDSFDPFPVIEVLTFPEVSKILLPPGFLETLPDSATAQALLLKHLKLLPDSP